MTMKRALLTGLLGSLITPPHALSCHSASSYPSFGSLNITIWICIRCSVLRAPGSGPVVDPGADLEQPGQHLGIGVEGEPAGALFHVVAHADRVGQHQRGQQAADPV